MKVNCAALASDLLEIELFGSERASSDGSVRTRPGKLELCEKGTILLSEIAELPAGIQAELVQVLQNKQFFRPRSHMAVKVDVRILAAITGNVDQLLTERRLREDLYHHLSAFTVQVPPLRQRQDELPLLLRHFMHHLAKHYGLPPRAFSPAILGACRSYSWPGNVKELEDFVKRCLAMGDTEMDFGELVQHSYREDKHAITRTLEPTADASVGHESGDQVLSLKSLVNNLKLEAERNAINGALEKTGWNRKAAARLLKVSYRTLLYKIEQYHMSSPANPTPRFLENGFTRTGNGFKGNGQRG
jgi:DNA-binding NtrC family response regulator